MKTPASILFDVTGIPTAVSASAQPTSGALGHVMAGFDATNSVRYAKFDSDSLKVTGSVAVNDGGGTLTVDGTVSAIQSGIFSVTGSGDVGVLKQDPTSRELIVTGSTILVKGNDGTTDRVLKTTDAGDLFVTGSVLVTSGEIAVTDNVNGVAGIETIGNRKALAVEYPLLLVTMKEILLELKRIRKHMESITEEEWSEDDDI